MGACYCDVINDLTLRVDRLNRWHDDLVHVEMIRFMQYVSPDVRVADNAAVEDTPTSNVPASVPSRKDV